MLHRHGLHTRSTPALCESTVLGNQAVIVGHTTATNKGGRRMRDLEQRNRLSCPEVATSRATSQACSQARLEFGQVLHLAVALLHFLLGGLRGLKRLLEAHKAASPAEQLCTGGEWIFIASFPCTGGPIWASEPNVANDSFFPGKALREIVCLKGGL